MAQENPLARSEPWDAVADAYACELLPMFEFFSRAALARAQVMPGARIADIATGPGTLALLAAAQGLHVTALDFSADMLEQLRQRAASMRLAGTLELCHGDGQKLTFPDNCFDAAFSMFGLIFFPDRAAGFRELRRVLKPGGMAIVTSWAWQHGPFGTVMDLVRAHLPGGPDGALQPSLSYPADYDREMTAAGFSQVRVETVAYERTFASVVDFWESVQRCDPGALQTRRKLGEETWAALRGPILDDMGGQWAGWCCTFRRCWVSAWREVRVAGYSQTPLAKKLGLKPGMRAVFLALPSEVSQTLLPLEGVDVRAALEEEMAYVHYFAPQTADLKQMMPRLKKSLARDGILWISWRKGKKGTDLTENEVRSLALAAGLVDVKVCAVDEIWSGLKLVYRLKDR